MLIGYARVSTFDQTLDSQTDALKAAGCEKFFIETASGARSDRPRLLEAIEWARSGDVICVQRLDRLGRSLIDLIATVRQLEKKGVGFRSLTETIDTASSGGRLVFHIFGALAEFERAIIRERTNAGLRAARQRGRIGGRPRMMTPEKLEAGRKLLASGMPAREVAEVIGTSIPTLYRWLPSNRVA